MKRIQMVLPVIVYLFLLSACSPARVGEETDRTPPAASPVWETETQAPPTLTSAPAPTAEPSLTVPAAVSPGPVTGTAPPIEPAAQAADLRLDSWSPDGAWLSVWLSAEEDLATASSPAPAGSLFFLDPRSGKTCAHPEIVSNEYKPQVIWQPDGQAAVLQSDAYRVGAPCGEFSPVPADQVVLPAAPDPARSPDGNFRAGTAIVETTDGLLQITTTITDTTTGEAVNRIDWEIDQRLGDLGLGGEWVTDDIFLIYETRRQGPLLVRAGQGADRVGLELSGAFSTATPGRGDWVSLQAAAAPSAGSDLFHLLLIGVGSEALFPPVQLYHAESGEVEDLPTAHVWGSGFSPDGEWVLLDGRPIVNGYERTALWVRPVDPPGSEARPFVEDTYLADWSPGMERVAFGWSGRFAAFSFPDGGELRSWSTGGYAISRLLWSPAGDVLAVTGQRPGAQEAAVFVVTLEE